MGNTPFLFPMPELQTPIIAPPSTSGQPADVILLDYVMTLVANTGDPRRHAMQAQNKYVEWIGLEEYRQWLVDLLRGRRVVLITARNAVHRKPTLGNMMRRLNGWMPERAMFNDLGLEPPASKDRALREIVFPLYGPPSKTRYLALESNGRTRAMYARHGITAYRVPTDAIWSALPTV